MQHLLPHLFRTEYRKLIAVLTGLFGFEHLEAAEDIASDTFLAATEVWAHKGLPENPVAWLYTVAKNKARDHLRRRSVFHHKIRHHLAQDAASGWEIEPDLSPKAIADSQLRMMFAVCHPAIPAEAQIGLALRVLCGFGIEEIAAAFLCSKDTISKRLLRAKEKLRSLQVSITFPEEQEMSRRLENVLGTLYLLFNEGYYAYGRDTTMRKELCLEAMRLANMLTENSLTAQPPVYALLALMCFHASRFEARMTTEAEGIVYEDQDAGLWNKELIAQGNFFLLKATSTPDVSKYHIEAAIACWHTMQADTPRKWNNILHLYDQLLVFDYSPMAALNRAYAVFKVGGKEAAIAEAEKLDLTGHHLYHSLLGELYTDLDNARAILHLKEAVERSPSIADKAILSRKMAGCKTN